MSTTTVNVLDRQELITRLRAIGTEETIRAADKIARDDEELRRAQRRHLDFSESAERKIDKLTCVLRDMAEALGVLHQFARNEQARDLKRHVLSPEADGQWLTEATELVESTIPRPRN